MNNQLVDFTSIEEPFLHVTHDMALFQQLYNELNTERSNPFFTAMIDGKNCSNKEALFNAFSSALQFPDYFGRNWDAFNECLNDLEWLDCNGYVLFLQNFEDILKQDTDGLNIFLEIMEEAIKEWTLGVDYGIERLPKPFHVVIHANTNIAAELGNKLCDLKLNLITKK